VRNSKKILSVLLAMLMLCSTFAIGAQAAYSEYKDSNISSYDSIDKPVFTAQQLASVALDEVDRMLLEMDETSIKVPIINVTIDYSSVDKALDSLAKIYNGSVWNTVTSIAGDLKNLSFAALNTDASGNFAANGCRRTTAGKSDLDVLYSLISFLYDNRDLLASYGYGTLDIGATLSGLLGDDIATYLDAPKLVKGILYKEVYRVKSDKEVPEDLSGYTVDAMLEKLVVDQFDDLEYWLAKEEGYGIKYDFSGIININKIITPATETTPAVVDSFYDNIERALQSAWNTVVVPLLNTRIKQFVMTEAGVKFSEAQKIKEYAKDASGKYILDANGNKTIRTVGYYLDDTAAITALHTTDYIYDATAVSCLASTPTTVFEGPNNIVGHLCKLDYTVPTHNFTGKTFFGELNNLLGDVVGAIVTPKCPELTWTSGDNDQIIPNLLAIGKKLLKVYGERYLSDYITIPTDAEIDALTLETAAVRFGKELVNKFVDYALIPDSCNSVRSILSYALLELIADDDASHDIYTKLKNGTIDPNSDNGWKAILAVFARHYANAYTNMNLPDGLTFDQTIEKAVEWGLENYGGILYYTSKIDSSKDAWQKLDEAIFTLIPLNWLPSTARVLKNGVETTVNITGSKVLILDVLLGNILDLKFNYLLDLFNRNATGELNGTPSAVLIGRVRAILNAIIPGTMATNYNNFEQILTKKSLGDIITGLFTGINTVKESLITSALPLVCQLLDLTTDQALEDPAIIFPNQIISSDLKLDGNAITIRNNSTGVNTGYTDKNGEFHQDALYKIKIKSITANNDAVSVSYTANDTLNGGIAKTYPVTGTLTASGLVRFCVSYEILDESGASLTTSPITNYFFTYVSADHADDDEDYYNTDADGYPIRYVDADNYGLNSHYVVVAPEAYISSWGALKNVSYSIGRESTTADYNGEDANVTFNSFTTTMVKTADEKDIIAAPTFTTLKTTYGGYIGERDLFTVTVPQVEDTENGGTKDADFTDYVGDYEANLTLTFGNTDVTEDPAVFTVTRNLHLYNDYNLGSIVSSALKANRQLANYKSGSTTEWNAYLTALTNAEAILLKPKTAATFDSTVYEGAATALTEAIEALEARAEGAGVDSLVALKAQYQPENAEDANYYDAGYNFFGSQDYVLYTYERFRTHRDNMNDLIDSQIIAEPAEGATQEEIDAYNKAVANKPTLALFDITYRGHMYKMNADRMIRTTASKNYLNAAYTTVSTAILELDETAYKPASWTALQNALTFAETVIADKSSDLRQTKVNTARRELVAAYKGLALKSTEPADYNQLNSLIGTANALYAIEDYQSKYEGLDALKTAYDAAKAVATNLCKDDQGIIDAAAKALSDALDAVTEITSSGDITIVEDEEVLAEFGYGDGETGYGWRPTFAEYTNNFIYDPETEEPIGVNQFICGLIYGADSSLLEAILSAGDAGFTYVPNENNGGYLATGDKIVAADGSYYTITIYGDCDGTGEIDGGDITQLSLMLDWMLDECEYGGVFTTAADIIADQFIDPSDFTEMVLLQEYLLECDIYSFPQDGTYGQ